MSVRFSGSLLSAIVCYILLIVIAQKINFDLIWLIQCTLSYSAQKSARKHKVTVFRPKFEQNSHVAHSCYSVIGDKPFNSYGASQNSTLRNTYSITKLGMIDYDGNPYPYVNFSWIWFGREFPANRWNITSLWLFVVSIFFVESPSDKTRERIRTHNMAQNKFCITKAVFCPKHA